MAFTDALSVTVSNPTKKTDYDSVADNTEFNREKADVDHDFDISTGDGYHNAKYSAGVRLVNDDAGNTAAATLFLDSTGALRIKVATGTTTPPTPSSQTDGDRVNVTTDSAGPSF